MTTTSIIRRSSNACEYIFADVIRGIATVQFWSGHRYEYHGVSRRALYDLINNSDVSMGFWINKHCVSAKRARVAHKHDFSALDN